VRCVIVLPTYNEAGNIVPFLHAVREAVPEAHVLVVDDNSPDGTGALAEQAAAALGSIRVIHRPAKTGLGGAYRHGFAEAFADGYDVVVSMDSDFSHDPAVIPEMLRLIDAGADLVIGSRYVPGGGTSNWPLHRRVLSRWGNRYTAFVLRAHVADCTSGFRAYRAVSLAAAGVAATTAEGYVFLTELVRRFEASGATVVETPITFRDRVEGRSKMTARIIAESMLRVTWWAVRDGARRITRRRSR
jgi:dolichol-phosphate mannosyltransferase